MQSMKKRLTEAQFQAAIKGLEIGQQTIDIARGVLVEGDYHPSVAGGARIPLADVAHTLRVGRRAFAHRRFPAGLDGGELARTARSGA